MSAENDHLHMLKRAKKEGNLSWGFPATMIKPSEDISLRIEKEIYEETRVRTRFKFFIGRRIHPDTKTITYYCALDYVSGDLLNMDDYENSDAKWVNIDEYKNLITSDLFDKVSSYLEE